PHRQLVASVPTHADIQRLHAEIEQAGRAFNQSRELADQLGMTPAEFAATLNVITRMASGVTDDSSDLWANVLDIDELRIVHGYANGYSRDLLAFLYKRTPAEVDRILDSLAV